MKRGRSSITTRITTSRLTNEEKDEVRYWLNKVGCDIVACYSQVKNKYKENWSDILLNGNIDFESRLENGFLNQWGSMVNYDDGVAIICGQLRRGPNKGKWITGFDFDSKEAVDAFCEILGISLEDLAKWTLVQWHGDRNKIHIFLISNTPFRNLAVGGIEVKANKMLAFVSPSLHKGDNEPYRSYDKFNTSIAIIDNIDKLRWESVIEIFVKARTNDERAYFEDEDGRNKYIEYLNADGTILRAGERHPGTVANGTSMFFKHTNGWGELSDDDRFGRLVEWHKKHCQPSLFEEHGRGNELKVIWNDICHKYTDKRQEERNNRPQSNPDENKTFEKELTAIYHFKGMKYTKDIFFYDKDKGIYVKDAEWLIEQECVRYNPEIKTKDVTDIKNRIMWSNYVDRRDFDSKIEWIAAKNCMINLKTLETKPHSPEFMATMQIPHKYEPSPNFISDFLLDKYQDSGIISDFWWQVVECPCPKIMKFLHEVMAPEDVETVLDFIAYCLWRGFPFHRYLLFNGSGRNGKGVTIELIKRFLGRQNISGESLQRILENRFASAELFGKLANIDADLSNEALKNTGILKKLTGGDAVPAEFKFKRPFHFVNFAKLIFSANDIPQTPDESDAFFARLIIINFPNQYLGNKAEPYLDDKIATEEELSGLLSIVLRRLPRVLASGIYVPNGTIEENYTKYIQSSNPIRAFVETMIEKDTDIAMNNKELKEDVDRAYQRFCNDRSLGIEGIQTFNRKLKKDYGFADQKLRVDGKPEWCWISIKLKEYVKVDEDQETF